MFDLGDDPGMLPGDVMTFPGVRIQVIELDGCIGVMVYPDPVAFPAAHPHGLLPFRFVEFPVQKAVCGLVGGVSQKGRQKRQPVHMLYRRGSVGERDDRRHEVPEGSDEVRSDARGNMAFPGTDHRFPDTAFVHVAFDAPEYPRGMKKGRVVASFVVRTVIAGKDHQRVIQQSQASEPLHQFAHVIVQAGDHRRICSPGIGLRRIALPVPDGRHRNGGFIKGLLVGLEKAVVGHLKRGMRERVRQEQKERLAFVPGDEGQGGVLDEAGRVHREMLKRVRQVHARIIPPQVIRIIVMGQRLGIIAEEFLKAALYRIPHRGDASQSPFSEGSRPVAGLFKQRGQGIDRIGQRPLPFGFHRQVAPDGRVTGMHPCQQHRTGRSAYRTPGVKLGEPDTGPGEAVQMGRGDQALSVATQVTITHVVGQDQHDIRRRRLGQDPKTAAQPYQQQQRKLTGHRL